MKTIIVSAFPACGKSWVFDNQVKLNLKVADSDSSKFSWIEPTEFGHKVRNPDFPTNYIEHIKSLVGEVDYILVSSHQEVRDALNEAQLPYVLVMPHRDLMNEWIGRCWLRGSPEQFLNLIKNNWDTWIEIDNYPMNMVGLSRLQSGEYLSDKLYLLDTYIGVNKGDLQ